MCVAPVKIHCQLVKVYGVCIIPWKQADTVHGFQQWQDRYWQVLTWAPSVSTTYDVWLLLIVIVVHLTYSGHFLEKAARVLSSCMTMTGIIHPTGQLFMAVHLIGYGSVPILHSVFYVTESLRTTWLASDCNRCWCEASYHLLATDTRQQCLHPWCHCGAMPRW